MSTIPQFESKCVLITGGAGGLGRVMAESLIKMGREVILAGRTEEKLAKTAKEINAKAYHVVDTARTDTLPEFVKKVTQQHPEIDCLINNAGIQEPINIKEDRAQENIKKADSEISVNISGLVHLCFLFVDHLKQKKNACIMNVSSGLAYTPLSNVPVYCATKAFVKSFTISLRYQLEPAGVKVIEIGPPLVESDLHRTHADPDNNKRSKNPMAMSQDEFASWFETGLKDGSNDIAPGTGPVGTKPKMETYNREYGPAIAAMNGRH